jgi:3D (Asp-Asp-Asp) domain-containing protein
MACSTAEGGDSCAEIKAKLAECGLAQASDEVTCSAGLLEYADQIVEADCSVLSAGKADWFNDPWEGCDEPCYVPGGLFNWFCKTNTDLSGSKLKKCCQQERGYYNARIKTCGVWGPPPDPSIGPSIGKMWNTYYYLAEEDNYSGTEDTTLYDINCNALAKVSAAFSDAVCVEGSGKLSSGTVINFVDTCSCGRTCPTGKIICYEELSSWTYSWGKGSFENPLKPLRSIAVENGFIKRKSVIYLKEWDGVYIPRIDGVGGFRHDGCFRADDVGSWIKGNHYDFFAGSRQMRKALEKIYPTGSTFTAHHGGERCSYLEI